MEDRGKGDAKKDIFFFLFHFIAMKFNSTEKSHDLGGSDFLNPET